MIFVSEEKMEKKQNAVPKELLSVKRPLVFVLGIFIGLAVIIPGVSGSAIAIMLGLYTAMLYSLGNVLTHFKRCVRFLLPLALGAVIGFGAGFIVLQKLFGKFLFEIVCLFVGFMIGALPAITKEIRGERLTPVRCVLFPLGFLVPIVIGVTSIILTAGASEGVTFTDFPVWRYVAYLPLGFLVSLTQIVPGLSATAILMAFGQFGPILNSVSVSYILDNPEVLGLYASLILGFAVGIVVISRIFSVVLLHFRKTAFFAVSGMSVGSIISMFVNPDVYSVYTSWANGTANPTLSVVIGVPLLVAGFFLSFLLTKYESKHTTQ